MISFPLGKMLNPLFALVNNPSNDNKMQIIDGHHRFMGALKAGKPLPAYVGEVESNQGPSGSVHSKQNDGKEKSISSNQINQEEGNQVKDSEGIKLRLPKMPPNGKTK